MGESDEEGCEADGEGGEGERGGESDMAVPVVRYNNRVSLHCRSAPSEPLRSDQRPSKGRRASGVSRGARPERKLEQSTEWERKKRDAHLANYEISPNRLQVEG